MKLPTPDRDDDEPNITVGPPDTDSDVWLAAAAQLEIDRLQAVIDEVAYRTAQWKVALRHQILCLVAVITHAFVQVFVGEPRLVLIALDAVLGVLICLTLYEVRLRRKQSLRAAEQL